MIKEYRNFWDKERVAKAAAGLTPVEATILASIVHKESVKKMKDLELPGISKSIEAWNASSGRPYGHICP
jgi:UPF0755 protein